MKRGTKKVPLWYLYLALAYALLGIFGAVRLYYTNTPSLTLSALAAVWTLFNVLLLLYFRGKYNERAYLLPTYYVGFFFMGLILLYSISSTMNFAIKLGVVSSIAEIGIVSYLFIRR